MKAQNSRLLPEYLSGLKFTPTKIQSFLVLIMAMFMAGCATTYDSKIVIPQNVQKKSYADQRLFEDTMTHGIARAEFKLFPNVKQSELTDIEPIVPYDNQKTGVERWTITHDGHSTCSYLVKFIPDGHGGTTFTIQKDDGKTER